MKIYSSLVIIFILSHIVSAQIPTSAWQKYKSCLFNHYTEQKFKSDNFAPINNIEKAAVAKLFFYSLLIPGLGEATLKKTGYTRFFLSVETILWGIYISNKVKLRWNKQDYKNYAVQHAGVIRVGKNDQYWIDIGKYDNIYEYNQQRRRDRDIQAIYQDNTDYYWYWDNQSNRFYYDEKRIKTRQMEIRNIYFIGGIILNHVVSAINALRLARKHNRQIINLNWQIDFQMEPFNGMAALSLVRRF